MVDPSEPLAGVTVIVTRAKAQASVLQDKLEALGAITLGVATIEIVPPDDGGSALRQALRSGHHQQIAVASPNGALALLGALEQISQRDPDLNIAGLPPVACVGPSTAAKLAGSPLMVNVVPDRAVAEGLVDALAAPTDGVSRLLLVQAEVARDALQVGLAANGWQVDRVTAYRTVDAPITDDDRAAARTGDIITFTSSSTVDRFVRLVGTESLPGAVASIGPITSATAIEHGLVVDVQADPHTIDGLVAAVVQWSIRQPDAPG